MPLDTGFPNIKLMANTTKNSIRYTQYLFLLGLLLFTPMAVLAEEPPVLPELIDESSEHFTDIESANLDGLLERIGDSRLVLLGEATHGTREFYQMRARITRELIENKGFNIIAVEADWPDAESVDYYIRGSGYKPRYKDKPFAGYPSWMWRNHSVLAFTRWLKDYNQRFDSPPDAVAFYGLDLYNIFNSIEAVLVYLQQVDRESAETARRNYACLMPWSNDPSEYSHVMKSGRHHGCSHEVEAVLQALGKKRTPYSQQDSRRYFNAVQNARLVKNGERYYRSMYQANANSWNQRDQNMFDTLQAILKNHGQESKAVIWAHNSHIGDARATSMAKHDEINLGQLVREAYGDSTYLIGFGTDHGTVAASSQWGGPMKVMQVQASHKDSYERLCHDAKADNFLLPLREPVKEAMREKLLTERLARAIGTSYDPEQELKKHYYKASLPRQFDEYIWFDETHAVKPLRQQ